MKSYTLNNEKKAIRELIPDEIQMVAGGTANKNPNPSGGSVDGMIDSVINGKNYDAIAQRIADYLNGDDVRTRYVDNNVDIYDCEI